MFKKKFGPVTFEDSYTMLLPIFRESFRKVILRANVFNDSLVVSKFEDVFNRSLRIYNEYGKLILYDEFLIKDFYISGTSLFLCQGKKLVVVDDLPVALEKLKKFAFFDEYKRGLELFSGLEKLNTEVQKLKKTVYTFNEIPTALSEHKGNLIIGTAAGNIYSMDIEEYERKKYVKNKGHSFIKSFYKGLKMPITAIYPYKYGITISLGRVNPNAEQKEKSPYILDLSSLVIIPSAGNRHYRFPGELIFKKGVDVKEDISGSRNVIKKVEASQWYSFVISFGGEIAGFRIKREREIEQFDDPAWASVETFGDSASYDREIFFSAKDKEGYSVIYYFEPERAAFTPVIRIRRYAFNAIKVDETYLYVGFKGMKHGIFAVSKDVLRDYYKKDKILTDVDKETIMYEGAPGIVGQIEPGVRIIYLILGEFNSKLFMISSDLTRKSKKRNTIVDMPSPEDIERELYEDDDSWHF